MHAAPQPIAKIEDTPQAEGLAPPSTDGLAQDEGNARRGRGRLKGELASGVRARGPPDPVKVFARIRQGLNVKVADIAPLIGITEAGLYRAIREKRIEAVEIGRAKFLTARVAGPLVGIEPEPAAPLAA